MRFATPGGTTLEKQTPQDALPGIDEESGA
jgi:hypothetical protein